LEPGWAIKYGWAIKLMLDHDEIEKQGLKARTKVLLGLWGTVVLILGFSTGWRGVFGWMGTTK